MIFLALIGELPHVEPPLLDDRLERPKVQVKLYSELLVEALRYEPFAVTGRDAAPIPQAVVDQGPP